MKRFYYFSEKTFEFKGSGVQNREYEKLASNATASIPKTGLAKEQVARFINDKWEVHYDTEKYPLYERTGENKGKKVEQKEKYLKDIDLSKFTFNDAISSYLSPLSECENLIEYDDDSFTWKFINDESEKLNEVYNKLQSLSNLNRVKNISENIVIDAGNESDEQNHIYSLADISSAMSLIENYNYKVKDKLDNSLIEVILS